MCRVSSILSQQGHAAVKGKNDFTTRKSIHADMLLTGVMRAEDLFLKFWENLMGRGFGEISAALSRMVGFREKF